jgi:hypothetical protein
MAAPVFLATSQVGVVNYWMTGTWWRSPYQCGDVGFQSLDWTCPHWRHVLFDTFHGLLPTHPLVGLGVLAAVVLIAVSVVRRRRMEAILWALSVFAIAVNVYFQGAWYCWWLAASPCVLGMRGLVLASVPALVALIRLVDLLAGGGICGLTRRAILVLSGGCLIWSWLLLSQGPMDYLSWSALLEGQILELNYWMCNGALVFVACGCVAAGMLRNTVFSSERLVGLVGWFAVTLVLVYIVDRHHEHLPPLLVWYGVVGAAVVIGWRMADHSSGTVSRCCASVVTRALFAGIVLSFLHLAVTTRASITSPYETPWRLFHAADVANAHNTLALIPRLESQRRIIAAFLERQKGATWCRHHLQQMGAEPRVALATRARVGDVQSRSRRSFLKRH